MSRVAVSVLLLASALTAALTLVISFHGVEAQKYTETVYVTIVQAVYVPVFQTVVQTMQVSVTSYATVTSVSTTAFSVTQSVTQWSTATSVTTAVTTAMGILGTLPTSIFGAFSDLAMLAGGAFIGAAAAAASLRLVPHGRSPPTGRLGDVLVEPGNVPDYAAIASQAERLNQLLPSTVKGKAAGIVQALEHYDPPTPSDLEKTVARKVRDEFKNLSRGQADIVSAYVLNQNIGITNQGLKSLLDDIKGGLDDDNELDEMTSLRLQMTMDRRSKFIETLSNIMKKLYTTQESLTRLWK